MELHIITPHGTKNIKEVQKVTCPGASGPFMVLKGHAPLVSILSEGQVQYQTERDTDSFTINNGIVKIKNNIIQVITD